MLGTIFRFMLITSLKDKITLFYSVLFPILLLIGLDFYFNSPAYHQTLLLGTLALSTLFWGVSGIAFQVHQQRSRGVYKLIRVTPLPTFAFILTMTLARTLLGLAINGIVFLAGVVFLKQSITFSSVLGVFSILALGTMCFSCIGFFVANLAKNEGQINIISNLLFLPMIFGSEVFYSLENAPHWVKVTGQLFPMEPFIKGLHSALGSQSLFLPIGLIVVFTCVWFVLAVITFLWNEQTLFQNTSSRQKKTSLNEL